jgi:hypothetical protein
MTARESDPLLDEWLIANNIDPELLAPGEQVVLIDDIIQYSYLHDDGDIETLTTPCFERPDPDLGVLEI